MNIYSESVERFGMNASVSQIMEEMGELIQALSKWHFRGLTSVNTKTGTTRIEDVLEEYVDVSIQMNILDDILTKAGITEDQIIAMRKKKILKLEQRLVGNFS